MSLADAATLLGPGVDKHYTGDDLLCLGGLPPKNPNPSSLFRLQSSALTQSCKVFGLANNFSFDPTIVFAQMTAHELVSVLHSDLNLKQVIALARVCVFMRFFFLSSEQ
jgi:hypothetical protein